MSKTKTKRIVASFLLLCAMSGGMVFADPLDWKLGDSLVGFEDQDGNILFDKKTDFSGLNTGNWYGALGIPTVPHNNIKITLDSGVEQKYHYTFNNNVQMDGGSAIYLFANPTGKEFPYAPSLNVVSTANLIINGSSEFKYNNASGQQGPGLGGAIYLEGAQIDFNGSSVFESNVAKGSGGAINNNGTIYFNDNVSFVSNQSGSSGGAIHVGSDGVTNISGGNFSDNKAVDDGGAIYSANEVILDATDRAITFGGNIAGLNTDNQRYNDVYLTKNGSLGLKGDNEISFGGSIEGANGSVISSSAENLILNGDNSTYQGTFTQASGKTTVKGKFFGGSNIHQINGGELVLAAANAIDGSKIAINNDANINVDVDTIMNENISGNGNITLDKNVTLTLLNDQSIFNGTYSQSSGNLVIGDGTVETKSFSGNNNISGGKVTVKNNATLSGTNNISGKNTVVTLENGSTLAGTNTISGGTVNINTSNNASATNTINGGNVNIGSGVTFSGDNTTLSAGSIAINNAVLDGLKEMTNGTLSATGATFKGTSNISGGNVTIAGGSSISEGASLNITGGNVDINQGITLADDNITGNGGTLNMIQGNTELNIQGDLSNFTGVFNKNGGTINIGSEDNQNGGTFFGGKSNISGAEVKIHDKGVIADGSTLDVSNTTIVVENNGFSDKLGPNDVPQPNGNESVISGNITGGAGSKISVDGESTYLVIEGDESGYHGIFEQNNGTTEIKDGGVFFAGSNTIYDGNFIFRDGAQLVKNVIIEGEDVNLTIGDGSKKYVIEDGNMVYTDKENGIGFQLSEVNITGTLFEGGDLGNEKPLTAQIKLGDKGGFASNAHYQIGDVANDKHGTVIMQEGSVAQDGSTLKVNNGSMLSIEADKMKKDAVDDSKDGKFETNISGDGYVYLTNNNDKENALVFTSDNSEFKGLYEHETGSVRYEGKSENDIAKFFGGTNLIKSGNVIFAAHSEVNGNNQINEGASFELTDGSTINKDNASIVSIVLNGGTLNITNVDKNIDLNIDIGSTEQGGTINKTENGSLTISANQHNYTGEYNQTGSGTTTVNAGNSFFGGKNTITNGVVDLTQTKQDGDKTIGAALAGENIISADGKILVGDFTDTSLVKSVIVNDNYDADKGLVLETLDGNNKNLDINFVISGNEDGQVIHSGNGALNLNNAGQNDLFANFDGVFIQNSSGITNVFGKSFKNNELHDGVFNLKDGSELSVGTTIVNSGATINIGDLKDKDTTVNPVKFDNNSKVTISGNIEGQGAVNISQGTTTIKGTSDNSAFEGSYHQTGGTVVAESGSTFFGGVIKNLIEHGKLLFKQDAKLAEGKDVELSGNQYLSSGDLKTPVLDLDGRTNARFDGSNKLVLDDEQESNEGFVFTNGILENAILHGVQDIVGNGNGVDDKDAVITLRTGSGLASDAVVSVSNGAELVFGTGSVAEKGSKIDVENDGYLGLVSQNLDWHTIVTGDGSIAVMKDDRETGSPNINIYGDQSGFKGDFIQAAGRVTVKSGSTFFGGTNEITGFIDVDDNDPNKIIKETSGDLYLEKGSLLGSDITVTNFDKTPNAGVSTPHGRVFVEDKIFTKDGVELVDIDELINQNNLYYNNILKADGTVDVDSLKQININNGGLILSNGTIFETPNGTAVFERKENGIIDIGFSNNTGVNGDILLKRDTMLSYGDNAFIKDDSTLTMEDTAILNFINDNAVVNYNPTIVGGGSIYKEGLAATNISSAIDMTGEVNVKEGTLNFTNKDKVIFKKGDDLRQTGNLTVGSNSANANLSIVAKETQFEGNVVADAQEGTQSGLYLLGKNTNIGGNLDVNNTITSITGNTSIGGNWNIDGNSSLSLIGNYANTIDVAGDLILGENLKDGKLPIAFDYDPHSNKMDTIIVDSFINDKNSPLLITGINFVTSPADRTFSLDADRLIQQRNPQDQPYYDPTAFYANTAMGRYYLTNGSAGGPNLTGSLVYLNPQQYRGQVATIASWQNQLVVNNMLFDHMDVITRQLMDDQKTANKYASAQPQFAPYQYDLKGGSLWYKAYGNFERLSMTRGLSVGNNAYGSLIGADFPLIKLKNGWNLVPTAYIGYNGAHQHFRGVSMYQNGAQLGLMGTAYKGNFITSLLAYGGGYGNDMSMSGEFGSGSDNTGNWFAGVASKTAYNIHLPADFIFQPTIMAAYNAFGSQNWGSDFGVLSMSSGMLNGINVAPGFNLIWQKKTFNIYATAQMVYNIMGGVDGRAGNIELGYVRMRHSYFEYGLGVSKTFKDRFNGFLQFTIRNGGRTGIGFTGGLQIKVGK